jgi:hypothetical protein
VSGSQGEGKDAVFTGLSDDGNRAVSCLTMKLNPSSYRTSVMFSNYILIRKCRMNAVTVWCDLQKEVRWCKFLV